MRSYIFPLHAFRKCKMIILKEPSLDLPLAEKNMLSALDFAEKSNDLISIGCSYRGLGEILKASEKAEDAAVYFEKAIIAFQKAGDTYGVAEVKELMSK